MTAKKVEIITPAKPVLLSFTGERASLPAEEIKVIEDYWGDLLNRGRKFTRGDVFSVIKISENEEHLRVCVDLSDYAHYLASRDPATARLTTPCKVMHTSILIQTADDFLMIGEMGKQTSTALQIQFPGGGITRQDLDEKSLLNYEKNARTELLEETGLDVTNSSHVEEFSLAFLKTGGQYDALATIFCARLALSAYETQELFARHHAGLLDKGEQPELNALLSIKNTPQDILAFAEQNKARLEECVVPTFQKFCGKKGSAFSHRVLPK